MAKKTGKPEEAGQVIEIKCGYDKLYQYKELAQSQGKLKSITKDATQKLINSIKNNGIVFPIYVWQHKGGILARIGQGVRNIANRFRIDPTRGGIF